MSQSPTGTRKNPPSTKKKAIISTSNSEYPNRKRAYGIGNDVGQNVANLLRQNHTDDNMDGKSEWYAEVVEVLPPTKSSQPQVAGDAALLDTVVVKARPCTNYVAQKGMEPYTEDNHNSWWPQFNTALQPGMKGPLIEYESRGPLTRYDIGEGTIIAVTYKVKENPSIQRGNGVILDIMSRPGKTVYGGKGGPMRAVNCPFSPLKLRPPQGSPMLTQRPVEKVLGGPGLPESPTLIEGTLTVPGRRTRQMYTIEQMVPAIANQEWNVTTCEGVSGRTIPKAILAAYAGFIAQASAYHSANAKKTFTPCPPLPSNDFAFRNLVVTSHFNLARLDPLGSGKKRPHRGTDFRAAVGTPVLSTLPGKVTQVLHTPSGHGIHVVVRHKVKTVDASGNVSEETSDLYSLYGHLAAATVKKGDFLGYGAQLGMAGNSGRTTSPHLHFEVWWGESHNRAAIDVMQDMRAGMPFFARQFSEAPAP